MLKAIHAQESKKAAREKAKSVIEKLRSTKLKKAAKKVEDGIEKTITCCDFPSKHWTRIRTNNAPCGRHPVGGNKKYMNMKHLDAAVEDASIAG